MLSSGLDRIVAGFGFLLIFAFLFWFVTADPYGPRKPGALNPEELKTVRSLVTAQIGEGGGVDGIKPMYAADGNTVLLAVEIHLVRQKGMRYYRLLRAPGTDNPVGDAREGVRAAALELIPLSETEFNALRDGDESVTPPTTVEPGGAETGTAPAPPPVADPVADQDAAPDQGAASVPPSASAAAASAAD